MAVRRLAEPHLQPTSFAFTAKTAAFLRSLDIVFGEVDR